jgi:hypothetical protein
VLFMAVATAAPITAMVGNVPISVGFGNGAFYGYISLGLGGSPDWVRDS